MSKIIKLDQTYKVNSVLRYIFVLLFVVSISLWITTIILINRDKSSNIDYFYSGIDSLSFDEDENKYLIKLIDYDYVFKVSNSFKNIPNLCENININDKAQIFYYKNTLGFDEVIVLSINTDNGFSLDLSNNFKNNLIGVLIGSVVTLIIGIVFLVLDIRITKKRYIKTYDYFEYYSKCLATEVVYYKDMSIENRRKLKLKAVISYIVEIILLSVGIAIFANIYPDKPHIIIPITIFIMIVITIILFILFDYRFYNKKNLDVFISKYFAYLNKKSTCNNNPMFEKDFFNYIDIYYESEIDEEMDIEYNNNNMKISYDDMKFYTYCYYLRKFNCVHIYICSDYIIDGYPLIIPLTNEIYNEIKTNNIHIEGLDYLLNNLKDEIIINIKNKVKYKVYKD